MVRVLGNSPERVKINDLNDVIYYHQRKEYTDQEYENSRDLKKEIDKGRVTLLERYPALKTQPMMVSEPVLVKQVMPLVDTQDIKKIILDVMGDYKKGNKIDIQEVKNAVSEVLRNMPIAPEVKQFNPQEIKKAVAEVFSEHQTETGPDLSSVLLSMIPMIADAVRQEVARIQIVASQGISQRSESFFRTPEYVPNVNTKGMESNIKGEERTVSGEGMTGALNILKNLNNK